MARGISTIFPWSLVARHSGDDLWMVILRRCMSALPNVAHSITMSKPAWLSMKGTSRHLKRMALLMVACATMTDTQM